MSKIKEWIKKGEGKTIEFKRTLPDGNHIAKTVIAFSNMAGGKIIIGIEDIIAGRSEIRNKVIARFFKEIEFIEQWGSGIRKMIRLLKQDGLPDPQFRESGLFFKIIIYKKETQETTIKTTTETTTKTSGESKKITPKTLSEEDIGTSRKMTEATTIETAGTNGETTAKTTAKLQKESIDNDLKAKTSAIKTSGEMTEGNGAAIETTTKATAKTTMIIQKESIDSNLKTKETTTKTTTETAKTAIILIELIRKKPTASLNELAEHLQLTNDGVRYHLKNLKQKGLLKRIGSSRAGYWKINENRIPKSTI
jgi:predicted HTH transcriptional regulator